MPERVGGTQSPGIRRRTFQPQGFGRTLPDLGRSERRGMCTVGPQPATRREVRQVDYMRAMLRCHADDDVVGRRHGLVDLSICAKQTPKCRRHRRHHHTVCRLCQPRQDGIHVRLESLRNPSELQVVRADGERTHVVVVTGDERQLFIDDLGRRMPTARVPRERPATDFGEVLRPRLGWDELQAREAAVDDAVAHRDHATSSHALRVGQQGRTGCRRLLRRDGAARPHGGVPQRAPSKPLES